MADKLQKNLTKTKYIYQVSVIIPTNNRCSLLKKAVNSVLNQSYREFELIIIDDNSSDNTEEYLKGLNEDKISYYKIEVSKGGNYARNFGIKKAKGEYIAFLDDDDEWLPHKLKMQVELLKRDEQVGLIYTGAEIIYPLENIKYLSVPKYRGDLSKEVLMNSCIGTPSSVMIKKSILNEVNYFDESLPALQDYDLWIRVCQICKIDFIEEPLIRYYNHTNITQISRNIDKFFEANNIISLKYSNYFKYLKKHEQTNRKAGILFGAAKRLIINKNPHMARKYLIYSFKKKITISGVALFFISFFDYKLLLKIRSKFNR